MKIKSISQLWRGGEKNEKQTKKERDTEKVEQEKKRNRARKTKSKIVFQTEEGGIYSKKVLARAYKL